MLLFAEYLGTAYHHIISLAVTAEKDVTKAPIQSAFFCLPCRVVTLEKLLFVDMLNIIYNQAYWLFSYMQKSISCFEETLKAVRQQNLYVLYIPTLDLQGQRTSHQEHQERSQWFRKLIFLLEVLNGKTESERKPQGAAFSEPNQCHTQSAATSTRPQHERKVQLR